MQGNLVSWAKRHERYVHGELSQPQHQVLPISAIAGFGKNHRKLRRKIPDGCRTGCLKLRVCLPRLRPIRIEPLCCWRAKCCLPGLVSPQLAPRLHSCLVWGRFGQSFCWNLSTLLKSELLWTLSSKVSIFEKGSKLVHIHFRSQLYAVWAQIYQTFKNRPFSINYRRNWLLCC